MKMAIKVLLIIAAIFVAAGAALFAAVSICAGMKRKPEKADCIIVLGTRVWPDGRMSAALLRRCERALEVWQEGYAPKMIVSGACGGGGDATEGAVMRRWMIGAGVPEADVFAETEAVNTVENLRNSRAIMEAQDWHSAIVVTSDYHVQRSLWIARNEGVQAVGVSAPSPDSPGARMSARLRESICWILQALHLP